MDLFSVGASGSLSPLLSNVDFGDFSDPLDLDAGAYTLGVDVNNDASPEIYFELPALEAGTLANVYVTQDSEGDLFALAQLGGAGSRWRRACGPPALGGAGSCRATMRPSSRR